MSTDIVSTHAGTAWFQRRGYSAADAYDMFLADRLLATEPLTITDYVDHLDDNNEPVWRKRAAVGTQATLDITDAEVPKTPDEERILRARICLPLLRYLERGDAASGR